MMNKKIVRASYESCLTATAKLLSYATSATFQGVTEVNVRQDSLAEEDLIVFSIHARRLIENTSLIDFVSRITISSNATPISLWKVINFIIHNNDSEILRCDTRLKLLKAKAAGMADDEYKALHDVETRKRPYSEPITPILLFKSDRTAYTLIYLAEFIHIFAEKVLHEIQNKALDAGLCRLDNPFKDLEMFQEILALRGRL